MSLLKIQDISMNYHSLKGETKALDNISFDVNNKDFICILGPSGCGKSTLLNIISGILEPSSGDVLYNNEDIHKHLDKLGYMFQKDHLFEWETVWTNVTLGLRIKKLMTPENKERVEHLLKEYDLLKFKDHYPRELSGGMRQRVALIRTLALNPDLLLLDEPFSALDYQTRLRVCDDVCSIIKKEQKTAIMVTHDISEAISLANRVLVLSKRPSTIKLDVPMEFNNIDATPFQRRKEPEFKGYFNELWKELDS